MALLEARNLTRRFGGIVAVDDVTFDVPQGEIVGLIGPNGAGKTTVFNLVTRLYSPDGGDIEFEGESLLRVPPHKVVGRGIARTFQNLALFPSMTVLENVLVGYDPTGANVASQVAQIKASKANAYIIFAFGKFAVQASIEAAKLGWKPKLVIVNLVATSANLMGLGDLAGGKPINRGAISIAVLKDPTDPKWAKDPGLAAARRILKKQIPSANPKDGYYYAGMASAMSLVNVLKRAGQNLTRASLMKAARTQNQPKHPLLIPGIGVKTSPADGFPIEQVALQRWISGKGSAPGHWSLFGPLRTAKS